MAPRTDSLTQYRILVAALADAFENDYCVRPQDLRPLTDDELAVVLNHDPGIGTDAARPSEWADTYNSVLYASRYERLRALAISLDEAIVKEARDLLCESVNVELQTRFNDGADEPDAPVTESTAEMAGAWA